MSFKTDRNTFLSPEWRHDIATHKVQYGTVQYSAEQYSAIKFNISSSFCILGE